MKKLGKGLLNECMEGFLFLLWFSSPPYISKILYTSLEDIFTHQRLYLRLHRLYKRGFIRKIKRGGEIFLTLKSSPEKEVFTDLEVLKR